MPQWKYHNDDEWRMQIGQIGCLVISPQTDYPNSDVIGWQVHWHEQCDYVYSEGIRLEPGTALFPFTDDGLQQAKQAGIEFARGLLTEALGTLKD